ncbi:RdgB/HAM1 family non-canonical purine NTP pyrophosphatase [Bacteroidota bacterium]
MENIVFATNNKHKLEELKKVLEGKYNIQSLSDIGFEKEIPEDFETIKENAQQKARYINEKYSMNCFADDTGLEIEALDGEPGVYSARYAGENCSYEDNMNKVLDKMKFAENRLARFITVICLIFDSEEYFFKGEVKGEILKKKSGIGGFGYDPIFKPLGFSKTFAEMTMEEKNLISHRGLAAGKLVEFLKNII